MSTHHIDRDRIVAGMLNDNPEMIWRYHNSLTFHQGVTTWADMAAAYLQGLAERANEADAEMAERRRLLESEMFMGPEFPGTEADGDH